jgi:hypothetical protein
VSCIFCDVVNAQYFLNCHFCHILGLVSTLYGSSFGAVDGVGVAANFRYPSGLSISSVGVIYVGDSYNFNVRVISTAGVCVCSSFTKLHFF